MKIIQSLLSPLLLLEQGEIFQPKISTDLLVVIMTTQVNLILVEFPKDNHDLLFLIQRKACKFKVGHHNLLDKMAIQSVGMFTSIESKILWLIMISQLSDNQMDYQGSHHLKDCKETLKVQNKLLVMFAIKLSSGK